MMMLDALRAELAKFALNRAALFWGVASIPILVLAFGAFGEVFIWATVPTAGMVARAPLITDATRALAAAGNPIFHVFPALAAATIFAGEYRWETWRFVAPRSRRRDLIAGKAGAFAVFAAISLVLTVLAALGVAVLSALLSRVPPGVHPDMSEAWAGFAVGFAASLLQLCTLGCVTALVAVVTRSMMGAVLTVFLFSLAQAIFLALFGEAREMAVFIAGMPNLAGDTARRWAFWIAGDPDAAGAAGGLAFAALAAWCAAPLAGAMLVFARQDLSQE